MTVNDKSNKAKIYAVKKRIFDVLFSFLTLIIVAPIFLAIAIGIKLSGPGPVLFKQIRTGLNGKNFVYLKFRTMRQDAIEQKTRPIWALRSDPRITSFGTLLRKTALDELPVLLSVLKGDMSVVGPRPALMLEIEHYTEEQRKRLNIKPGLTGYWQTFGRVKGIYDANRMIEMDLEYASQQSFLLDLKIIAKTVWMGLSRKAAY